MTPKDEQQGPADPVRILALVVDETGDIDCDFSEFAAWELCGLAKWLKALSEQALDQEFEEEESESDD